MNTPLMIVFNVVANFALLIIFLRFMFQFAEIDKNHPYTKVAYNLSAVVTVFRRIFPDLDKGRISLSAVILMLLLTYIKIAGNAALVNETLTALTLFFVGTLSAILDFINALIYTIVASAICSLLVMVSNKMHPIIDVLMQMSEPIIAPFRRIVPPMGMIDMAGLAALLTLSLLEKFIQILGGNILQGLI